MTTTTVERAKAEGDVVDEGELIDTLTELSAWLLFGGESVGDELDPDGITRRTVAAAFVLRISPLHDRGLARFAADYGWSQQGLAAVADDFSSCFRVRSMSDLTTAMRSASVPRKHGTESAKRTKVDWDCTSC